MESLLLDRPRVGGNGVTSDEINDVEKNNDVVFTEIIRLLEIYFHLITCAFKIIFPFLYDEPIDIVDRSDSSMI